MTDSAAIARESASNAEGFTYTANPGFQELPLALIDASPTNPRKTFDKVKLEELAASIKSHGVLQPVLVRFHPKKKGRFELVAGERRWRASKIAEATTIPVNLQDLDDLQTLEIQVIENLQRDDLHPLEEAEGYDRLMKRHQFTVEQLAEKVGKSKAYIYARLKLCALDPAARKPFLEGIIDASMALLVARIPVPELQRQAMKEIASPQYGDGPMSFRRAAEHVRARYMLRLDQASFKPADATLVPNAGACTTCPKRTGNSPDLFGDVGNDNVCTDPDCFSRKGIAHAGRIVTEAKAAGRTVLTGKEAKKVLPNTYSNPDGFVKLEATNYDDEKTRTWAKLLGKEATDKVVLVQHPNDPGKFVELVSTKDANAILKAKGLDIKAPKPAPKADNAATRREQLERELQLETRARAYLQLREKVGTEGITNVDLRAILRFDIENSGLEVDDRVLELWGVLKPGEDAYDDAQVAQAIEKAEGAVLLQMVLDVLVSPWTQSTFGSQSEIFKGLIEARGIDAAAIEAQVREEMTAKAAEAKPAKKPAKAKP